MKKCKLQVQLEIPKIYLAQLPKLAIIWNIYEKALITCPLSLQTSIKSTLSGLRGSVEAISASLLAQQDTMGSN